MIGDEEQLGVAVRLTARQEILSAGNQDIPGLISWGGAFASNVFLGQWRDCTRIELPGGRSADMIITRIELTDGTIAGSGEPPLRRVLRPASVHLQELAPDRRGGRFASQGWIAPTYVGVPLYKTVDVSQKVK